MSLNYVMIGSNDLARSRVYCDTAIAEMSTVFLRDVPA
jgi:hypothetical protein